MAMLVITRHMVTMVIQPLSSLELHPLGYPADHSALPEVVRQRRSPAVRSRSEHHGEVPQRTQNTMMLSCDHG